MGGRDAVQLARDWTRTLRDAIRSQDRSHLITIGLLPFRDCAFDPRNVADLVDLVTMHEYPAAGEGGRPHPAGDAADGLDEQALAGARAAEVGRIAQEAGGEVERLGAPIKAGMLAAHGRPLLLGETFAFDRPTQETFLLAARRWLDGSLSFYDGRAPEEVITTNPADAAYRQNLISYLGLRTSLQASPRWPSPAVATPRDDEPRGLPHRSR